VSLTYSAAPPQAQHRADANLAPSYIRPVLLSSVDVQAAAIYATELALWVGVMLAGIVFNFREWIVARYSHSSPNQASELGEARSSQAEDTNGGSPHGGTSPSTSRARSAFYTSAAERWVDKIIAKAPLRRRKLGMDIS
jgi:hypothetical protein